MQEHRADIRGNIANYTDIAPVVQISEVVVEQSDRWSRRTGLTTPARLVSANTCP